MRIDRSNPEIQKSDLASRVRETGAKPTPSGGGPAQPVAAVPRVDRVEISDAGRALAAKASDGPAASAGAGGEMSADRVTELRQRVLSGAYDSLAVVDQVARRMLQNGDV